MGSSRLPGKVLLPAGGQPLLGLMVDRLKRVPSIDSIVIATTGNARDDELEAFAQAHKVHCFRGSEDDVVERVIGAGESIGADVLVSLTGDCPLVDPQIVEQSIQMFLNNNCEYVSTGYIPSYPAGVGDNQVFFLETLKRSAQMSDDPAERENVGMHIHKHPELFTQVFLVGPPELCWSGLHLLLDTPEDYELLKLVVDRFGDRDFGCSDIIELFKSDKSLLRINDRVPRNDVDDGRPVRGSLEEDV